MNKFNLYWQLAKPLAFTAFLASVRSDANAIRCGSYVSNLVTSPRESGATILGEAPSLNLGVYSQGVVFDSKRDVFERSGQTPQKTEAPKESAPSKPALPHPVADKVLLGLEFVEDAFDIALIVGGSNPELKKLTRGPVGKAVIATGALASAFRVMENHTFVPDKRDKADLITLAEMIAVRAAVINVIFFYSAEPVNNAVERVLEAPAMKKLTEPMTKAASKSLSQMGAAVQDSQMWRNLHPNLASNLESAGHHLNKNGFSMLAQVGTALLMIQGFDRLDKLLHHEIESEQALKNKELWVFLRDWAKKQKETIDRLPSDPEKKQSSWPEGAKELAERLRANTSGQLGRLSGFAEVQSQRAERTHQIWAHHPNRDHEVAQRWALYLSTDPKAGGTPVENTKSLEALRPQTRQEWDDLKRSRDWMSQQQQSADPSYFNPLAFDRLNEAIAYFGK